MTTPVESTVERLQLLWDQIAAKRVNIESWNSLSKDNQAAFEYYNFGLTTALDMLGRFTSTLVVEKDTQ